jgi:fumarylacetoacetase
MKHTIDAKHLSFINVTPDSHFPIRNLPYGAFRRKSGSSTRLGVAIGDYVLDLTVLEDAGLFNTPNLKGKQYFSGKSILNDFMAAGRPAWRETREIITQLLRHDVSALRDQQKLRDSALIPINRVELLLPVEVGDYTDFYSSRYHATNVGSMFRDPENALLPNYLWIPIAYHGRASSVVTSGTEIHRPLGQTKADDAKEPTFGPGRLLDFELEMGFLIGPGNELGQPIPIEKAPEHIFGMVLVNDWSARDIQKWEYQPLGPFLSKNFATTVSPWIVTLDALEPFRCAGPAQAPEPLSYLRSKGDGSYDIHLEVHLQSEKMNEPSRVCRSNFRHMYWNIFQQLAHHTVSGCNVRPGDLMASGTISGPTPDSYGSLLELAWRGTKPVQISPTEKRSFIQDHDTIIMTGWCQGEGYRVGFGEVRGKVLPPVEWKE